MSATVVQLEELQSVNARVNAEPYVADDPAFGELPDTWKVTPDGKGFLCRDYTIAKANELINEGWAKADLSVVLCWTELGEYHAVLAVEAGGETWILDNRAADIYRWNDPPYPYRWALRQVAGTDEFKDVSWA